MSIHPIAGIDYGNSLTNLDLNSGIRYGVIGLNSIAEALDYFEPVYDDTPNDAEYYESEPIYFEYAAEGYELRYSTNNQFVWVFKSPYVTECKFCSPCVPGAGDLDNPVIGGVQTYCLDSSWFNENKAPYDYTKL